MDPKILVGLFIGGMLPYLFCSLTMQAVGRAAGKIVVEVRRQFKEIKGLFEGTAKADYVRCVGIATSAAQRDDSAFIAGGVGSHHCRYAYRTGGRGRAPGQALVSGFVLAVMMANSGGPGITPRNILRKEISGAKGSLPHKAAVVGGTVGDPFKDTAGPSLNILIKLMSMVSIVFASLSSRTP